MVCVAWVALSRTSTPPQDDLFSDQLDFRAAQVKAVHKLVAASLATTAVCVAVWVRPAVVVICAVTGCSPSGSRP